MATAAPVLAVCVNYNGAAVLESTLRSLAASRHSPLEVLVVDSASTDGSVDQLPDSVGLLRLSDNAGYAAALNAGIRRGRRREEFEWFLLLNNDVELDPDAVARLLECGQRHSPAVVGPLVLNQANPSRLDSAWGKLVGGHTLARFYGRGALATEQRWQQERRVELLLGCALLMHREIFEKVGEFDTDFFMYHEEVDFLFRCGRSGIPVVFCPGAVVRHRGAWSSRDEPLQKVFWTRRNTLLFLRKHGASTSGWARYWLTLGGSLLRNAVLLKWGRVGAIVRGVREGLAFR